MIQAAYVILIIWCAWCVLSDRVTDGILGRAAYGLLAIAAYAAVTGGQHSQTPANTAIVGLFAFLGLRHALLAHRRARRHRIHQERRQ